MAFFTSKALQGADGKLPLLTYAYQLAGEGDDAFLRFLGWWDETKDAFDFTVPGINEPGCIRKLEHKLMFLSHTFGRDMLREAKDAGEIEAPFFNETYWAERLGISGPFTKDQEYAIAMIYVAEDALWRQYGTMVGGARDTAITAYWIMHDIFHQRALRPERLECLQERLQLAYRIYRRIPWQEHYEPIRPEWALHDRAGNRWFDFRVAQELDRVISAEWEGRNLLAQCEWCKGIYDNTRKRAFCSRRCQNAKDQQAQRDRNPSPNPRKSRKQKEA